jgi:3-oxoacyl-[acyl-carrier protein] reductase
LTGKVALVTGAGRGIGNAIAKLLAERGAAVICNSLTETCVKTADEIVATGGRAIAIRADVADSKAVEKMVAESIKKFGTIDILINNAGFWNVPFHPKIEEVREEDWDRILAVNLTGTFNCCRFVVPYMRKKRYGKIVNIGSGAGLVWSRTGIHAYAASKAGLMGFTRQLAKELGPFGINVNCVSPGLVWTNPKKGREYEESAAKEVPGQIPLGRLGDPIDIAYAVAFMVSDEASWITGQTLEVDGGRWMK